MHPTSFRVVLLGLISSAFLAAAATPLTTIPSYAWNNRGLAAMAVWFQRAP